MARMWSRTRALRLAQRAPVILLANALLRAAGTLVFIFVGRISGPEDAGVLSLALGYLAILTTLFTGLDDLLIREVTAAPKRVTALLLAYAVLRLPLTALLAVVVLLIGQTGSQLSPEQQLALRLIVSSALLDGFAGLGQIVLYAFGGFRLLVLPAAVMLLLRAGIGPLLLLAGGFAPAAAMWPLSSVAGAALLLYSARRVIRDAGIDPAWQPVEWSLVRHLGRLVPGFGAVSLLSALEYQLDVILLSKMRSPVDVGMYGAAISIINVVALIPQAYRTVLYPDLVRQHGPGRSGHCGGHRAHGALAGRERVRRAVRRVAAGDANPDLECGLSVPERAAGQISYRLRPAERSIPCTGGEHQHESDRQPVADSAAGRGRFSVGAAHFIPGVRHPGGLAVLPHGANNQEFQM